MTHSKILEARFTTFKELREEFIKAAELVGLTIIRRNFVKEFLNLTEGERPSDRPEFDRIFTSSDLSDIRLLPSDRKNTDVSKKGRKIYIKLSDGETTFPALGDYKRTAQYGLLSVVDLQDLWVIAIRKNGHGSFKIVKEPNISIIEVDLKLGTIIVLDTPHKEKVKEPSSDRSVLPNIQSSGCFEEITTLHHMLRSLLDERSPGKFTLTIALFQALITLLNPVCRESSYLKAAFKRSMAEWGDGLENFLKTSAYVDAIDPDGTRDLSTDARWIVESARGIYRFIDEIKNPQKKPFTETPKVSEGETSHSLTAGIEKANHLMEERNAIIESLAFSRIGKGESTVFGKSIADRMMKLFVPGEDVYSALLHYHSRATTYARSSGIESQLLKDLETILYAGMPKDYSNFNDKVDKEILHMFNASRESQRSR